MEALKRTGNCAIRSLGAMSIAEVAACPGDGSRLGCNLEDVAWVDPPPWGDMPGSYLYAMLIWPPDAIRHTSKFLSTGGLILKLKIGCRMNDMHLCMLVFP